MANHELSQHELEQQKVCTGCGVFAGDGRQISDLFGWRNDAGKLRPQPKCKNCRSKKKKDTAQKVTKVDSRTTVVEHPEGNLGEALRQKASAEMIVEFASGRADPLIASKGYVAFYHTGGPIFGIGNTGEEAIAEACLTYENNGLHSVECSEALWECIDASRVPNSHWDYKINRRWEIFQGVAIISIDLALEPPEFECEEEKLPPEISQKVVGQNLWDVPKGRQFFTDYKKAANFIRITCGNQFGEDDGIRHHPFAIAVKALSGLDEIPDFARCRIDEFSHYAHIPLEDELSLADFFIELGELLKEWCQEESEARKEVLARRTANNKGKKKKQAEPEEVEE